MSLPPGLVTAALVGTSRVGLPAADNLSPELATIHTALAGRPPEEALLLLAGAAALHDAAGRLPERVAGFEWRLPAYRPEGDLPVCSPAAAHLLERMFNQQETAFLPGLLALLDTAGLRAPDALLPQILEHGMKIPRMRPLLLPIVGERGRWLGAINPTWRYATVDLADPKSLRGAWESDPAGRAALATTVRRRDPAAARRLIETTWRAEPEAVRRELLVIFENGLSLDDEPFLERALDDRDALVRRKAADLLAGIPGSRLVGRITDVAGSILVLKDGSLTPTFPGVITEVMMRDGIVRHDRPGRPTSTRTAAEWSRLLIQTVGVIPLAHWQERFVMSPEAIIAAALAGKWPRTLMTAFATAAVRQRDFHWIDPLLIGDGYSERTGMLLPSLPPAECYARLASRLAARDDTAVIVFMRRWSGVWDEASALALIDFLGRHSEVDPDTRLSPTLRFLSRQFAQRCPPSLAGYAAEALRERRTNKAWEVSLTNVLSTLALRRELSEAVGG